MLPRPFLEKTQNFSGEQRRVMIISSYLVVFVYTLILSLNDLKWLNETDEHKERTPNSR